MERNQSMQGAFSKAPSCADDDPNENLSSSSSSSSSLVSSSSSLSSWRKTMVPEHNYSRPSDLDELKELFSDVEAQQQAKGDVKQVEKAAELRQQHQESSPASSSENVFKLVFEASGVRLALKNDKTKPQKDPQKHK